MRIAILTHGDRPFGSVYAQAFARAGHEVEIISLSGYDGEPEGVSIRRIGDPSFDRTATDSRWQYIRTIRPLRRAVRELQPDVLFALYMSSAGLAACLRVDTDTSS